MRLTDCFMGLIAYTAYFQRTVARNQPSFDQVRIDVQRLLTQSESCLRKDIFAKEDYDLAHFAVCAWVDEALLASPWREKDRWQHEQLQRLYYHTTEAGEEFFDRLNSLGLHQRDVREVYYLCLAMGFMGRHIHQGDEFLLAQVRAYNLKILLGSSLGVPSLERVDLFPHAYASDSLQKFAQKGRSWLPWHGLAIAVLVSPIVLYALLFFIYRFVLNGMGDVFIRAVS